MKKCPRCGKEFPATKDYFYGHKSKPDGLTLECKDCTNIRNKKYILTGKGKKVRKQVLWKHNGIKKRDGSLFTFEDFEKMFSEQSGVCAICKTNDPGNRQWHVDHDHKTGFVRAVLCMRCNTMLGHSRDNIYILKAAIEYLDSHK